MRRDIEKITAPIVPAKTVNYIFPVIISALLGISFSFMLTTTYGKDVEVKVIPLVLSILLYSVGATCFHLRTEKKKWLSVAVILSSIFIYFYLILRHGVMRSQIDYMQHVLRQFTFKDLPSVTFDKVPSKDITGLLASYNLLPALVTTWAISRRKSAFWCVPLYIPLFICSVALNYMFPSQIWCEIILALAMVLCFYQNFRKGDRNLSDQRLLKLMVPVMTIILILGACFPQSRYDQQKVAARQLNMIRKMIGLVPNEAREALAPQIDRISNTYMGSIIMESISNQLVEIDPGHEDLNLVGNFNPPEYTVFYVTRNKNPNNSTKNGAANMYIRTASSDTYTGHEWKVSGEEPSPEDIYAMDDPIPESEAPFFTRVNAVGIGGYYFAPYYTDGYTVPSGYENKVTTGIDFNVRGVCDGAFMQTIDYASDEIPLKRDPSCWSQDYLNYVYDEALYVPDETRQGILNSGLLPGWYIDLYNGVTTMSDLEKVMAVTDYVRSIHPYDVNTTYPPSDMDFVVWFMTESETGFCVHYACTAAVLLRMVGVPARYATGYLVSGVKDDTRCSVTSKDSHAWIEFFDPEFGWIIADPTPGNKAAESPYGASAIMKKYDISDPETTPGNTPRPGATPTPVPVTGKPGVTPGSGNVQVSPDGTTPSGAGGSGSTGNTAKENALAKWIKKHHKVLLPVVLVILLLVIIRSVYTLVWLRKFRKKNVNERARAYYHYFMWISKKWRGKPYFKTKFLAQKAVFSEKGITEKELSELKESVRISLKRMRKKQPWYKKIGVSLLYEVKV